MTASCEQISKKLCDLSQFNLLVSLGGSFSAEEQHCLEMLVSHRLTLQPNSIVMSMHKPSRERPQEVGDSPGIKCLLSEMIQCSGKEFPLHCTAKMSLVNSGGSHLCRHSVIINWCMGRKLHHRWEGTAVKITLYSVHPYRGCQARRSLKRSTRTFYMQCICKPPSVLRIILSTLSHTAWIVQCVFFWCRMPFLSLGNYNILFQEHCELGLLIPTELHWKWLTPPAEWALMIKCYFTRPCEYIFFKKPAFNLELLNCLI